MNSISQYQAAIFDLDGTLLDTLDDLANSGNEMLSKLGFPTHPREGYRHFVGSGVRVLLERILPSESQDEATMREATQVYRDSYEARWNDQTKPYEGIRELVKHVAKMDLKLAVLSNKPHDFTKKCVDEFLSDYSWDVVCGMREGSPKKPEPGCTNWLMEQLQVPAERCLYFGDTDVDMLTACGAGFHPIGVLWGFRERGELEGAGAKTLLEHPHDFVKLFA